MCVSPIVFKYKDNLNERVITDKDFFVFLMADKNTSGVGKLLISVHFVCILMN